MKIWAGAIFFCVFVESLDYFPVCIKNKINKVNMM